MIPSLGRMPRVVLGHYPTPMTKAKTLSKALGGPRILIKRDDLSGLALGGNKCCHIEFLMDYVKEKGYDIVLCREAASMELKGHDGAGGMGKAISRLLSEGTVVLRVFI